MLLSALLGILVAIVNALMSLLPNMSQLPQGFQDAWTWGSGFIANITYVVPAGQTLLLIVGLMITIEMSIFIWKTINWVLNLIRGSGN